MNLIRIMPAEGVMTSVNNTTITVNGEIKKISATHLHEILTELNVDKKYIAVAVNDAVIPSAEYEKQKIHNGDRLEIIQAVCGG